MKIIIKTIILVLTTCQLLAQSGISYQSTIRDVTGQVYANQEVSFRFSILLGDQNGSAQYVESHTGVLTDRHGRANVMIGFGNPEEGDFEEIEWEADNYFFKVELDPEGGTNFEEMGISQLGFVPTAGAALNDHDQNSENEIQFISKSGNVITLSLNGGSFILLDDDPGNEIQDIIKNDSVITLTQSNNAIILNDDNPNNEIQTIHKNGNVIELSHGGGSFIDNDDNPTNELQDLSLSYHNGTNNLSIGGGVSSVNLSSLLDSKWTSGFSGIYNSGRVAIGTQDFSGSADLTVGGTMNVFNGDINLKSSAYGNTALSIWEFSNTGFLFSYGSNSQENVVIGTSADNQNHGYIMVCGSEGIPEEAENYIAGMYVEPSGDGRVFTDRLFADKLPYGNRKNAQWDHITGEFFQDNSSRRYKENIQPIEADFKKILSLQPVTYTRPNYPDRWEIGYIAEDAHELGLTQLVEYDEKGQPDGFEYDRVNLFLIPVINDQQKELELQKQEIEELRSIVLQLQSKISQLEK